MPAAVVAPTAPSKPTTPFRWHSLSPYFGRPRQHSHWIAAEVDAELEVEATLTGTGEMTLAGGSSGNNPDEETGAGMQISCHFLYGDLLFGLDVVAVWLRTSSPVYSLSPEGLCCEAGFE